MKKIVLKTKNEGCKINWYCFIKYYYTYNMKVQEANLWKMWKIVYPKMVRTSILVGDNLANNRTYILIVMLWVHNTGK